MGVAIVYNPNNVLILYDFSKNETWPRGGENEHYESVRKRGEAMLSRLALTTGKKALILGY